MLCCVVEEEDDECTVVSICTVVLQLCCISVTEVLH